MFESTPEGRVIVSFLMSFLSCILLSSVFTLARLVHRDRLTINHDLYNSLYKALLLLKLD